VHAKNSDEYFFHVYYSKLQAHYSQTQELRVNKMKNFNLIFKFKSKILFLTFFLAMDMKVLFLTNDSFMPQDHWSNIKIIKPDVMTSCAISLLYIIYNMEEYIYMIR
jgi:hypothetical protein